MYIKNDYSSSYGYSSCSLMIMKRGIPYRSCKVLTQPDVYHKLDISVHIVINHVKESGLIHVTSPLISIKILGRVIPSGFSF